MAGNLPGAPGGALADNLPAPARGALDGNLPDAAAGALTDNLPNAAAPAPDGALPQSLPVNRGKRKAVKAPGPDKTKICAYCKAKGYSPCGTKHMTKCSKVRAEEQERRTGFFSELITWLAQFQDS